MGKKNKIRTKMGKKEKKEFDQIIEFLKLCLDYEDDELRQAIASENDEEDY